MQEQNMMEYNTVIASPAGQDQVLVMWAQISRVTGTSRAGPSTNHHCQQKEIITANRMMLTSSLLTE